MTPLARRDRRAFARAAAWAGSILASPSVAEGWDDPASVARYRVGGLAAHLAQGLARLDDVLARPAPEGVEPLDLVGFFGTHRLDTPDDLDAPAPAFLRRLAEDAAAAGPAAVAASFAACVERVGHRLAHESADRLVPVLSVPGAATRLDTYLTTRVVELVVHGDDLMASVDPAVPLPAVPALSVDVALAALVTLARARSGDAAVLAAFTRRERAEPGRLLVF